MLSTVALVGRPNVGKSTLFNRLTRSRDALVADFPGVTRDRRYGLVQDGDRRFLAVDTGGLGAQDQTGLAALIEHQVELALNEADVIVLVVDCREGLTAEDQRIAGELRRIGKPLILAVNKSEGQGGGIAEAEFHALGVGEPCAIAARSGQGISHLLELLGEYIAPGPAAETEAANGPTIAVIGRPNVGKSTLINRLLGADRLVTSNVPGTTRDSVMVQCERDGRRFVMVDTAGVRRRARVTDAIEKYSIVQTLQAIGTARVVILLIDATEGITDQDLHLLGLALEQGRAIVIGLNKWDGLPTRTRTRLLREVDRQLSFTAFADVLNISALHGSGIAELLEAAFRAYRNAGVDLTTPDLNAILARILEQHPPPLVRGRRPKLRYVHQGGKYPPTIVIHGGQLEKLPHSYTRYLENAFRGALRLRGTPLRIELRTGENPFAGRRNKLTPRQERRRKRVISHGRRK